MNGEILAFIVYFVAIVGVGIYFFFKEKGEGFPGQLLPRRKTDGRLGSGHVGTGVGHVCMAFFDGTSGKHPGFRIRPDVDRHRTGSRNSRQLDLRRKASEKTFQRSRRRHQQVPAVSGQQILAKSNTLQVICAIIFFVCFTIYVASAYVAGASVFTAIFPSLSSQTAMLIFALAMLLITFFGGFKAVCWTDFFPGTADVRSAHGSAYRDRHHQGSGYIRSFCDLYLSGCGQWTDGGMQLRKRRI